MKRCLPLFLLFCIQSPQAANVIEHTFTPRATIKRESYNTFKVSNYQQNHELNYQHSNERFKDLLIQFDISSDEGNGKFSLALGEIEHSCQSLNNKNNSFDQKNELVVSLNEHYLYGGLEQGLEQGLSKNEVTVSNGQNTLKVEFPKLSYLENGELTCNGNLLLLVEQVL